MMKKLFAFVLCVFMVLSLVACDTPSDENGSTTSVTGGGDDAPEGAIFETNNIKRITFYAYYGAGKGSDVPAENMTEIKTWLGTFTTDEKVEEGDLPAPGTNTYYVEIEYLDGTIVKTGLDIVGVDGVAYYVKHAAYPDCFYDIISKTSLGLDE